MGKSLNLQRQILCITNKENKEFELEDRDELLMDAAKLVIQHQQASVSLLQRKFRIGYSRAGRLIDELESLGIISGYSGSKAREVLVDHAYLNEVFNEYGYQFESEILFKKINKHSNIKYINIDTIYNNSSTSFKLFEDTYKFIRCLLREI